MVTALVNFVFVYVCLYYCNMEQTSLRYTLFTGNVSDSLFEFVGNSGHNYTRRDFGLGNAIDVIRDRACVIYNITDFETRLSLVINETVEQPMAQQELDRLVGLSVNKSTECIRSTHFDLGQFMMDHINLHNGDTVHLHNPKLFPTKLGRQSCDYTGLTFAGLIIGALTCTGLFVIPLISPNFGLVHRWLYIVLLLAILFQVIVAGSLSLLGHGIISDLTDHLRNAPDTGLILG